MIWLPVLALILGAFLAFYLPAYSLSGEPIYVAVAALAGLDSLLGGFRARAEGSYRNDMFITGFLISLGFGGLLVYLSGTTGIQLYLGAVVAFSWRSVINLSRCRRLIVESWDEAAEQTSTQTIEAGSK